MMVIVCQSGCHAQVITLVLGQSKVHRRVRLPYCQRLTHAQGVGIPCHYFPPPTLPLGTIVIHTFHNAGVDMNPAALAVLRRRAAEAGLSNVQACNTMIEGFHQPFNIALAL